APGVAAQFLELELAAGVALREIHIGVLGFAQHAVAAPEPAVIGAAEPLARMGIAPGQALAAMAADIVEGLDGAVVLADADHAFMHEIMDDIIARLLQLLDAAGHVPDALPHMLPLFLHELAGGVAVAGYGVAAEVARIAPVHGKGVNFDLSHETPPSRNCYWLRSFQGSPEGGRPTTLPN